MVKVQFVTLSQSEVVGLLYSQFGSDRAWADFLTDCCRADSSTNYYGHSLRPTIRLKVPGDRCKRPRYEVEDVRNFVKAVLKAMAEQGVKPDRRVLRMGRRIEMDSMDLNLPLNMRRAVLVS